MYRRVRCLRLHQAWWKGGLQCADPLVPRTVKWPSLGQVLQGTSVQLPEGHTQSLPLSLNILLSLEDTEVIKLLKKIHILFF